MAEKYVVKAEAKELLRSEQRHTCLLRRAVPLSLVTFYTGCNQVVRSAFSALSTREDMIQRQLFCVFCFAAILAAIAVADVDPGTLHCRFPIIAADVDVVAKANNGRHWKRCRWRMQHVIAIIFLNKDRTAKPKTNGTSNTHGAERLVRKVQQ